MSDGHGLVPDDALSELLGGIWNHVVRHVNKLLEAHEKFGFLTFRENLNPSLEEVIAGFEYVDLALSKLEASGHLQHDEQRTTINSRQCILKIRMLALALDEGNDEEYERIISDLKQQAP